MISSATWLLISVHLYCQCMAISLPASGTISNTSLYAYPNGPKRGSAIEYSSYYHGGSTRSSTGLTASHDVHYLTNFQNLSTTFNANAPNLTRFLPSLSNGEFETQEFISPADITNIYLRNGSYPITRLSPENTFWQPACNRMAYELNRLHDPQGDDQGRTPEVMIKHYGTSLPDDDNNNKTVWTYITARLHDMGSDSINTFNASCASWFGDVAGSSDILRYPKFQPATYDWIQDGKPVLDQYGKTLQLPAQLLRGTAGGVKAVQGSDGSNFTLWVVPDFYQ